jgi:hypothetical protein
MSERKTDEKWNTVCHVVDRRDGNNCRLCMILTPGEMSLLGSKSKQHRDRAHVFPRSLYPSLIYNPNNIVKLNHYSHINLDNCLCPLTGNNISRNERDWWWVRITNKSTEKYDENIDYTLNLKKQYYL